MSDRVQEIKDRYFRSVIAHPEGAIVHFGDCWWYCCQICNCGLHSDLAYLGLNDGAAMELYPKFLDEQAISHLRREQLLELPVPEIKPLTPEEQKQADQLLQELFSKFRKDENEQPTLRDS